MKCEIKKRKEGSKKYLCIEDLVTEENEFRIQMILNNNIKRILPAKISIVNNKKEIVCDVTGLSTLSSMYDRKRMNARELIALAQNIKKLSEELHKYLLNIEDIVFETDYIYYNKAKKEYVFCYCPGLGEDYQLSLKELFSRILDYVDHNDRETVEVAYGMQTITTQVEFTIEEVIEYGVNVLNQSLVKEEQDFPIDDTPTLIEGNETEEKKESLWKKIWDKISKKKEFVTKDEIDEGVFVNNKNEKSFETPIVNSFEESIKNESVESIEDELDTDVDDDRTMLLTGAEYMSFIKLKSVDDQEDILIVPLSFPFNVGKKKGSNDYCIDKPEISREHMSICMEDNNYYIKDLESTNGTFVNGVRIKPLENTEIKQGDIVKLADVELEVM